MIQEFKTLFLVRHAKAEKPWDGLSDIDRPLHPEGIFESHMIAEQLFNMHEIPQLIISSPAQRAIGTALIFQKKLKVPFSSFRIDETLYDTDTNDLYEFVSGLDDKVHSIMIFGHNPSFSSFSHKMDSEIIHMPTGSVVRFDFEVQKWRHTSYINAERKLFLFP